MELKLRVWKDGKMYGHTEAIRLLYNRDILLEDIEFTIMFWTGLKDKNGKEIYEGDIILFNTYSDEWIQTVIKFGYTSLHTGYEWGASSEAICFYLDGSEKNNSEEAPYGLGNNSTHYEVIGNIHENHKLIK